MSRALRAVLPRTLRGRLIAGLLALLALACAAVGVATSLGMDRFLLGRVDQQLAVIGVRYPASLEHGERYAGRGDSRGQSPGTLGVRLVDGQVTDAAVVTSGDDAHLTLTADDRAVLAALPADGRPRTVELSRLDDYRVAAARGQDGDVLVVGLPMHEAEETLGRLQVFELLLFGGALVVTGIAGAVWVRLSLRPLERVAATAREVARLPLAAGAVSLDRRVRDTDPRTETGAVGAAFNRMLGHVEEALARRHAVEQRLRAFAADASHELRTPLAAIRGHAELALRGGGPMPAQTRHALERIDAESGRMSELVDDLLLLARLDAGRPLATGEVDLTRLALEATGDARAAAPEHRWLLELPEEPVTVRGDAGRLHQVVANLLANARTHTPDGTSVTVALRRDGGVAELSVADDGPGVPEHLQEEIFERFSRVDRGRSRASGGTGLGLAIVRAVVTAHGGEITVRGRPGATAFVVRLPAAGPGEWAGPPASPGVR
ncbi:HAMP domain-containing histidine kinase [Actinomadura sp. ATCC 31491]|uniref:histidine kinase n=1 Tax=Actinomadura luzonensis TaxID=2805427 RepID=A0ABT0FUR8_9ACTN|nr:HAMP domain-containing sensor histidine kinase [Actinomadura luzonensis]MCK2216079.1 HAMP domain-containing histidine kinase [Actinomadura luzonensis]